jgi:HD-GYP domain-containing protein (c-di-GMP phosphodiesterase class II)
VFMHHERWDGNGYPLGLKAQDIPLFARIISVADTYDAMTSDRAYRKALPHDVATREICDCAGTQFDPEVADNFLDAIAEDRQTREGRGDPVPA